MSSKPRHRRELPEMTIEESLEADGVVEFGDYNDDDTCPVCDSVVFGGLASFDLCATGVPHA